MFRRGSRRRRCRRLRPLRSVRLFRVRLPDAATSKNRKSVAEDRVIVALLPLTRIGVVMTGQAVVGVVGCGECVGAGGGEVRVPPRAVLVAVTALTSAGPALHRHRGLCGRGRGQAHQDTAHRRRRGQKLANTHMRTVFRGSGARRQCTPGDRSDQDDQAVIGLYAHDLPRPPQSFDRNPGSTPPGDCGSWPRSAAATTVERRATRDRGAPPG